MTNPENNVENCLKRGDPISQWIDGRLDKLVERRAEEYARRFSLRADGSQDKKLSDLIRYEVHRRGHLSKELDIFEPIRWTGLSFVLSFGAGMAVQALLGGTNFRKMALSGIAGGLAGSAVSLVRPYLRFDAALYGGAQTAVGMYHYPLNGGKTPGKPAAERQEEGETALALPERAAWQERERSRPNRGTEWSR